jgi:hypothetical protein
MPRRSAPSRSLSLATSATLAACALASCAPHDAQVGVAPTADGGSPRVLFEADFAANGGAWQVQTPLDGARVTFGAASPGSADGHVAQLLFPGSPALVPTDRADPRLATEIESSQYFRFGTFRARVQFATCAPTEEIASAVFMYFGSDHDGNGNGITDTPELDFHVLGGTPSFIVLTAWSDYELVGGVETFRQVSRAIDMATGDLYDTLAPGERGYTKTGQAPELAWPGFPAPNTFYDVGIDWQAARVRFFIVRDGVEVTLWTMSETAFVPEVPLPLMFNVWHPGTHWVPARSPADYPANDSVFIVDRAAWTSP